MSKQKITKIGLFGFGVVGEGLYKTLQNTPELNVQIEKVCIKNINKLRNAPEHLFTTDRYELINHPDLDIIVEVITDEDVSFEIVSKSLLNGKTVVSASKKMIANNLETLLEIAEQTQSSLLYESAVCASIPVIRNLEEYYNNDFLHGIQGIINGSTNYILSRIIQDGLSFDDALKLAQNLGFAEADPSLDVEGIDAVNKLCILLLHTFGIIEKPNNLLHFGIQNIQANDAIFADQHGFDIKLIGVAHRLSNGAIASFVLPSFVSKSHPFHFVKDEYNGVIIHSGLADQQFFYGKGAGSFPTASAVLSDIAAQLYQYKYEYKKRTTNTKSKLSNDFALKVYIGYTDTISIPQEAFIQIDAIHQEKGRNYITGVLSFEYLCKNQWWQASGISLILLPDPIYENNNSTPNEFLQNTIAVYN